MNRRGWIILAVAALDLALVAAGVVMLFSVIEYIIWLVR